MAEVADDGMKSPVGALPLARATAELPAIFYPLADRFLFEPVLVLLFWLNKRSKIYVLE